MSAFVDQALAFPTIFLSAALVIVLLYWAFVIIGALDIDQFDFDGAAEGAVEGAAEGAAEGVAEGAMEGAAEAADGAFEGAAEGIEGAAEGVEGAAEGVEGAAEGADGAAEGFEAAHQGLSLIGLMNTLGLRRAPLTVTFSLLTTAAWLFCMLGMQYVAPQLRFAPAFVVGLLVLIAAGLLAIPITNVGTRPLEPLFVVHEAEKKRDLIGRTCRVDTGSVDGRFGQGTIEEGGGWTVIQIRNDKPNGLERGDEALIISYDRELEAFFVEPLTKSKDEERHG